MKAATSVDIDVSARKTESEKFSRPVSMLVSRCHLFAGSLEIANNVNTSTIEQVSFVLEQNQRTCLPSNIKSAAHLAQDGGKDKV
jgi:ABC-type thiamine transport system ATPase subunit